MLSGLAAFAGRPGLAVFGSAARRIQFFTFSSATVETVHEASATEVDALGRAFSIPPPHSRYSRDSRRASRSREFTRAPAWPSELRSRAILPEFLAESHRGGVFPYPVSRSRRCRYRPKSAEREKSAETCRGIWLLRPGRPVRPKSSEPRTGPVLRGHSRQFPDREIRGLPTLSKACPIRHRQRHADLTRFRPFLLLRGISKAGYHDPPRPVPASLHQGR